MIEKIFCASANKFASHGIGEVQKTALSGLQSSIKKHNVTKKVLHHEWVFHDDY